MWIGGTQALAPSFMAFPRPLAANVVAVKQLGREPALYDTLGIQVAASSAMPQCHIHTLNF